MPAPRILEKRVEKTPWVRWEMRGARYSMGDWLAHANTSTSDDSMVLMDMAWSRISPAGSQIITRE